MTKTVHLVNVLLPVVDVDGVLAARGPSQEPQDLALCRVTSWGSSAGRAELGNPRVGFSFPTC